MKDRKGPPGEEGRGNRVGGEKRRGFSSPATTHTRLRVAPPPEPFPPHDTETPQENDSYSKLVAALSAATEQLDAALASVQDDPRGTRRHPSGPRTAPPLVLVVDDNEDIREVYTQTLQAAGFRTATAENGRVAIEKALALKPHAILIDYWMPVMDGAGATRILMADTRTSRIPTLLVTAVGAPPGAILAVPCRPKFSVPDDVVSAVRALIASAREQCG